MRTVQRVDFRRQVAPVGLLSQDLARDYLRLHGLRMEDLASEGVVPFVLVPRIQPDRLRVHVRLLEEVLYRVSAKHWRPLPQYGRRSELGTRDLAIYLGLSDTQIRGLVHAGHLPHEQRFHSGTTEAFRFRVEMIDGVLDQWLDAWQRIARR